MRVLSCALMLGVSLGACTFGDTRQLVLDGPPSVRTDALGPVVGPTAVLSDGSAPEGLTWSVSPDQVATLDGDSVTAVAAGEATVTGSWNGQQVQWTLVVDPAVRLTLVSPPPSLVVGTNAQLTVDAQVGSSPVDPGPLTWTSSEPDVLTVSATGQASARSAGTAYVIVKRGASEAMAEIQVVDAE